MKKCHFEKVMEIANQIRYKKCLIGLLKYVKMRKFRKLVEKIAVHL